MGEISEKKFLGFKWPPKMASYRPKRKVNTVWVVHEYPNEYIVDTEMPLLSKHTYDTELEAKSCKKMLQRSKEQPVIIIDEIYGTDEDGWTY